MKQPTRTRARPVRDRISAGGSSDAKVLRTLADPKLVGKSTTAKIQASGVSRATWYRRQSDPFFRARMNDVYFRALSTHVAAVLHALAESAIIHGRKGHADRKLLLELVGLYEPTTSEAADSATRTAEPVSAMTDEQLLEMFRGREERLPIGVLRRLGRDPDAAADAPVTTR
jgi:hypothetical protein